MSEEIKQIHQKIDCDDILKRKSYPTWFFSNERTNKILTIFTDNSTSQKNITNVFSIGGGGDFAFSISSIIKGIKEVYTCDTRPTAPLTIDIKKALFLEFSFEEILKLFSSPGSNKKRVYEKIANTISHESRTVLDGILSGCKQDDFLQCIKKSGPWYKYSFWQVKHRNTYLLYLTHQEKYQRLKESLEKVHIYYGDFNDNLKLFQDGYFDLIYVSNIFDSKNYCKDIGEYLRTIKKKLADGGYLFVVTQGRPKRMIKLLEEKFGFLVRFKELHRFNIITSLLGHYSYSFLVFRKI